ncbi:hypothetical protein ACFFK0_27915 [Paenibacillus chartarius]|uniref:Uncharacterized protein n=1 Tax=Paenibacillus chartarius TaxID=747481 RepID=A0ABV6DUN2_9BACL
MSKLITRKVGFGAGIDHKRSVKTFIHDFSDFAVAAETDRQAIEAIGSALEGSDKPFVVTSGTLMLAPARIGTEDDEPIPVTPRRSEEATIALAKRGGAIICRPMGNRYAPLFPQ